LEEKWGSAAIHIAAGNGHDAVVTILVGKSADINMQVQSADYPVAN